MTFWQAARMFPDSVFLIVSCGVGERVRFRQRGGCFRQKGDTFVGLLLAFSEKSTTFALVGSPWPMIAGGSELPSRCA